MGRWVVVAGVLLLSLGGCIPNQQYEPRQEATLPPPEPLSDGDRQDDRVSQPGDTDMGLPPPSRQPWEMRPVTADAQDVADSDYIVQPGDTLRGIAGRTGAGSEAIARANGIAPPFVIVAGQRLHIPGGRYHLVRAGQTGIAIARAYGVPWSAIVEANELVDPYVLRAGQRVIIPDPRDLRPHGEPGASSAGRPVSPGDPLQLLVDDIVTGGEPALASNARPARPSTSTSHLPPPDLPLAEPARLSGGFAWPVDGTVVKRFGRGTTGERNDGIKIAVPLDTPVRAAADGVVAYTGNGVAGLGGLVIVKHGDGWTTVYGHADKILVQRGQSVRQGQSIALSGQTGFADRPELHFEMRKGRTPTDPLANLPSR